MTDEPNTTETFHERNQKAIDARQAKRLTFAELKASLDAMTPEQLAAPVVWSGDERGGYVREVYTYEEDWIGEPGDHETWLPRSETLTGYGDDYVDAKVVIPKGTVHLAVD